MGAFLSPQKKVLAPLSTAQTTAARVLGIPKSVLLLFTEPHAHHHAATADRLEPLGALLGALLGAFTLGDSE